MRHLRSSRRRARNKTRVVKVVTVRRAAAKNTPLPTLARLVKIMRLRVALTRPTRAKSIVAILNSSERDFRGVNPFLKGVGAGLENVEAFFRGLSK